jgi:hypothetical protein
MRKNINFLLLCLMAAGGSVLLPGCLRDSIVKSYKIYTPVYSLKSAVLAGINGNPSQPIAQAGQIYIKGSFIYLNDVNSGIHIIDNSDPSHPVQTAFLSIPGNENIAIRGNTLYADMYSDLLAIDISNPHQVKITGAVWGFFIGRSYGQDSGLVITRWIEKDTSFTTQGPPQGVYAITGTMFFASSAAAVPAAAAAISASTGTAGSSATMTLVGNYLYAIPEEHSLGTVDVTDSSQPTVVSTFSAGYDLETIFPIQNRLLLGSKEGVYIYSIDTAGHPTQLSEFTHGSACDPVIADNGYAYVTLHAGTTCGGAANELDVLAAPNISQATLLKSYPMTGPSGLGKDGSTLFVCDGPGVKVFNASDPANLLLLSTLDVKNAYDVIAANHLLLVITTGGLYEFDYSVPNHIVALGSLAVN